MSHLLASPCSPVGFDLLSIAEVRERGVSLDFVLLAEALRGGAVQLAHLHNLVVLELGSKFFPGGG